MERHIDVNLHVKRPGVPVSGDAWYEVDGTSPNRTLTLCLQDGDSVIRIPQATW